jgi:hypothetical protein
LSAAAVGEVTAFAALAVWLLERGQARAAAGELDPHVDELLAPRQPVYLAQGMIMADLRITADEAVPLLRAHAFSLGRPVMDVAQDVVAGPAPPDALTIAPAPSCVPGVLAGGGQKLGAMLVNRL